MNLKNALAIMVKAPEPGRVKTRFTPPLSPEEAATLYRCFIEDFFLNISPLASKEVDIFAAYTPAGGLDKFDSIAAEGVQFFPQEGDLLGDRIFNVFRSLFNKGYKKVAITGSDSPDLPIGRIKEAFLILKKKNVDIVLGPATDGGYYLVAMKGLNEAPFIKIPWSTGRVLKATLKRAGEAGLKCELLDPWHDMDRVEDLKFLKDNPHTKKTSEFLKTLGRSH
ncbi:MAG: TIGR04282 family arsenosugar biosynthesis glycosyltransferase [Thermodesulfobacteriota bacterium]